MLNKPNMPNNDTPDDFEVALAVARDILEWPSSELDKIKRLDNTQKRAFVEYIKTKLQHGYINTKLQHGKNK